MAEKLWILHTLRHANNSIGYALGMADQPLPEESKLHTTHINAIVDTFNTRLQEAFDDLPHEVSHVKDLVQINNNQEYCCFPQDEQASEEILSNHNKATTAPYTHNAKQVSLVSTAETNDPNAQNGFVPSVVYKVDCCEEATVKSDVKLVNCCNAVIASLQDQCSFGGLRGVLEQPGS